MVTPPGVEITETIEPGCCGGITWTFPALSAAASARAVVWITSRYEWGTKEIITMNILVAIVAIIAVILLFTGGFVPSLNFLLWVGIVLLVIAVIVWLVRMISGRRSV